MRLAAICCVLALLNAGGWLWALLAFRDSPVLLGIALTVYGLGLRHAVDADHIAAIDNVTRKLMQSGQRPLGVGFWFALGHSTLVVLATAGVVGAAGWLGRLGEYQALGGTLGTVVSAVFLLAIAAINLRIFVATFAAYRHARAGRAAEGEFDPLLHGGGLLARLIRPLFRLVSRSWHMFPLGVLFGLGFDTATEVAMFSVAGSQVSQGVPVGAILVFPVLFAAGMSLVDTLDGLVMLRVYDWAFITPRRKLAYNMGITLVSVVLAGAIGGVEAAGLLGVSGGMEILQEHSAAIGLAMAGLLIGAWGLARLAPRGRGRLAAVRS
jgi:high-affinity nickel-transport protein